MSDFTGERVQRIADVTFNETDGEGAVAEWWDMLASVDADLATLTEGSVGDRDFPGQAPTEARVAPAAGPSVSAASHTTTDQHADAIEAYITNVGERVGTREVRAALAVLRVRAAAADNLADSLRNKMIGWEDHAKEAADALVKNPHDRAWEEGRAAAFKIARDELDALAAYDAAKETT